MQANSCPFDCWKCGKEGRELKKDEYHENEKCFFDERKTFL